MYDGLSKNDLRIILAHQNWRGDFYPNDPVDVRFAKCFRFAGYFLAQYEALNAESESSAKRDDGEGEGTRV